MSEAPEDQNCCKEFTIRDADPSSRLDLEEKNDKFFKTLKRSR
jgi:hypothetical protein